MTDLIHLMGIVGVERAVERRSMRRPRAKFVSVLCSPIPCRLLNARAARLPFIPLPSPVRPSVHGSIHATILWVPRRLKFAPNKRRSPAACPIKSAFREPPTNTASGIRILRTFFGNADPQKASRIRIAGNLVQSYKKENPDSRCRICGWFPERRFYRTGRCTRMVSSVGGNLRCDQEIFRFAGGIAATHFIIILFRL